MSSLSPDASDLSVQLVDVIRTVPGVESIYSSQPLPAIVLAGVAAARMRRAPDRLVRVVEGDTVVAIYATIGVQQKAAARRVSLDVHTAILNYWHTTMGDSRSLDVVVKVGRVG